MRPCSLSLPMLFRVGLLALGVEALQQVIWGLEIFFGRWWLFWEAGSNGNGTELLLGRSRGSF